MHRKRIEAACDAACRLRLRKRLRAILNDSNLLRVTLPPPETPKPPDPAVAEKATPESG